MFGDLNHFLGHVSQIENDQESYEYKNKVTALKSMLIVLYDWTQSHKGDNDKEEVDLTEYLQIESQLWLMKSHGALHNYGKQNKPHQPN